MAKAPELAPAPAKDAPKLVPAEEKNDSGSVVVNDVAPPKKTKPVHPADAATNAIERENHERAVAAQQNIPLPPKEEAEEDELRKLALARNERLKERSPVDDADRANRRPANWSVTDIGGGNIEAFNRVTGATYEGPRSGFMKK